MGREEEEGSWGGEGRNRSGWRRQENQDKEKKMGREDRSRQRESSKRQTGRKKWTGQAMGGIRVDYDVSSRGRGVVVAL